MNNWLALISALNCILIVLLTSEPTNAQYTVKRNPKLDVKKDSYSSYHEPDLFALDTLAGIGLGKRSKMPSIARFQPTPVTMNENSFRFLDNNELSEPSIWSLFDQMNQRIPEKPIGGQQRGQMEVASVEVPEFSQQLQPSP